MHVIETKRINDKLRLEIGIDECCDYVFDELFDQVSFISNSRDIDSYGPLEEEEIDEFEAPDGHEVVPVVGYEHGRVALSLSADKWPFNCQWDSGVIGLLVFETGHFGKNNIGLKPFLNSMEAALNGDVYYLSAIKSTKCECCSNVDDEVIDSIGALFGYDSLDDMFDLANEHFDLDAA